MSLKTYFKKIRGLLKNYVFVFREVHKTGSLLLIILIISTLFAGCLPLTSQYVMKIMISSLEEAFYQKTSVFGWFFIIILVGVYMIIIILRNAVQTVQNSINHINGYKLTQNIQKLLINKLKKLEYKAFYSPGFQNQYNLVLEKSKSEPMMVIFTLFRILSLIIQVIGSLLIILNLNFFILIELIICLIFVNFFINLKIEESQIKVWEDCAEFNRKDNYFFDILTKKSFMKELRLFSLNSYFSKNKNENFHKILMFWNKFSKKELLIRLASTILSSVGIFISIVWIIKQVIDGRYFIADFIFYTGIVFTFETTCSTFIAEISYHYKSMLFISKLLKFLNTKNDIVSGNSKIAVEENNVLEFINVYFKYPNTENYALKNINFKIKIGDKISLVGKNGCGKTTLVNLILRIYDQTEGSILLNGIDIKNYDFENYLSFFSAVFQDYQQYCVPIIDYISFGDIKNFNDISKIKQAVLTATASDFIEKSEKKFESNLTKSFDKTGLELSGGQWQRLAISRVFFSNAKILIFDEPTSALDAISESKIYENIKKSVKAKWLFLFRIGCILQNLPII